MVLQEFFTERQIDLLLIAVSAQEKKWRDISKRPVRGYGTVAEEAKKRIVKCLRTNITIY